MGHVRKDEFTVNNDGRNDQIYPAVTVAEGGSFIVVWQDNSKNTNDFDIWVKGYHYSGEVYCSDRCANYNSNGPQQYPDVAIDGNGRFVVVWEDDLDENNWLQILARGFSHEGK